MTYEVAEIMDDEEEDLKSFLKNDIDTIARCIQSTLWNATRIRRSIFEVHIEATSTRVKGYINLIECTSSPHGKHDFNYPIISKVSLSSKAQDVLCRSILEKIAAECNKVDPDMTIEKALSGIEKISSGRYIQTYKGSET